MTTKMKSAIIYEQLKTESHLTFETDNNIKNF